MPLEIMTERRGAAIVISFHRPERGNAFTPDMATQLFTILKPVTTDRAVRAVLLKGSGGNFMDGLEMSVFDGDFGAATERVNQMFQPYHSVIRELLAMDKPVLAVVDGNVAGPGMSFMLASDLVLAARSTKFNCRYTSYGMTPDGSCSVMLARKAGMMKANELLMLSENFGPADAEKWNLITTTIDDEKLHETALSWIDRLAEGPTRAYGAVKKLVNKAFEQDVNNQISLEHAFWGSSVRSFDFREALRAHAANRPTKFTGA